MDFHINAIPNYKVPNYKVPLCIYYRLSVAIQDMSCTFNHEIKTLKLPLISS